MRYIEDRSPELNFESILTKKYKGNDLPSNLNNNKEIK